jgi:hypothetical protein
VRAEQGLRRAIERDSTDAGVLGHLLMLAARRADTAEVKRIAELRRKAAGLSLESVEEDYFTAAFLNDSAQRKRLLALVDTTALTPQFLRDVWGIAFSVHFLPRQVPAFRELLDHLARRASTEAERSRIGWLQAMLAWDAGRPSEASAHLGSGRNMDVARVMAGLFWDGDSVDARKATARLATGPLGPLTDAEGQVSIDLNVSPGCTVALWSVAHGETGNVAAAARSLRTTAEPRDPAWPPTEDTICAMVLEARSAQLTRRPEARALVHSLDRLLLQGPSLLGMTWQNLEVARMLEEAGEPARAAAAARRFRMYYAYMPFQSTYYREAGRLAEQAGEREHAIEGYARFVDLRRNAEPALQGQVAEARAGLKRLTGERP